MKKKSSFKSKVQKSLTLYNILFVIVVYVFCFFLPRLLSYPPNSVNTEFERNIDMGFNFNVQCIAIAVLVMIVSNGMFLFELKKIKGWQKFVGVETDDEDSLKKLEKIKYNCFKIPSKLYVAHALIPPIAALIGLFATGTKAVLSVKITIALLMMFLVLGLLIFVFSRNIFAYVLGELKCTKKYDSKLNMNGYKTRMFLQFLPLVLLMGTFAYLVTDAIAIEEKGDVLFNRYYADLQNVDMKNATSLEDAKMRLSQVKKEYETDTYFILDKEKVIYQDNDEVIDEFYITYTWFWENTNHTYGYYASGIQGACEFINIDGTDYAVGIMYSAQAHAGTEFILGTILIISLITIIFLVVFARDFSMPINKISEYMNRLASGESVDYEQKLAVTSNDEIGDLTINFNKILDLEKKYVDTIKQNQEMLVENERLSSLGQLIGGIAHNLKTPIMSVSGYLVAMEKLANEYRDSIGNPNVTKEDYEEITKEMKEWIDKSKDYMTYMTEVINAAKGQAVSMNANTVGSFTTRELIARTKILMREELKKYNCNMNIKINMNEDTSIQGELSAIVQVLDNLISNAMQAYGDTKGDINITVNEDTEKVYIEIEDFAGGIPEHIKEKLFKEMITTKGKNGTGLGLYMCYSTIKGKFNGDLKFNSKAGEGTTFYITLNKVR